MVEYKKAFALLLICFWISGVAQPSGTSPVLQTGAEQMQQYLPLLKGKKVGLVVNQTSVIGKTHLVDALKKRNVAIQVIFAPEHGFRGNHEAGALIKSGKDAATGIQVISLYGNHKKPTIDDLKRVDLVIFDIQDVGARFYTYISTLHYVMEACAEQQKPLIVLDRPNPNGHYIDGPVLDTAFRSFVGMHPIPVVHGMTIGEYARMINGEKWLKGKVTCKLTVVKMTGYTHTTPYTLPVKPSPNLPTPESIALYPSVCFFEGTNYSLGRGTDKPFECIGKPQNTNGNYTFTPKVIPGAAENPPYKNELCRGYVLTDFARNILRREPRIYLDWMITLYRDDTSKATFFNDFFDTLAGGKTLREQIVAGKSEAEIRESWRTGLMAFRPLRAKYLLYPDFEFIDKINKN